MLHCKPFLLVYRRVPCMRVPHESSRLGMAPRCLYLSVCLGMCYGPSDPYLPSPLRVLCPLCVLIGTEIDMDVCVIPHFSAPVLCFFFQ
jgi:hypothetical protein